MIKIYVLVNWFFKRASCLHNKVKIALPSLCRLFVCLVVIDNLRLDQWKTIQPLVEEYYSVEQDGVYCGILPTATQYARNALFSGLMPLEIEEMYPALWVDEEEETGKNLKEKELLEKQLERAGFQIKVHTVGYLVNFSC